MSGCGPKTTINNFGKCNVLKSHLRNIAIIPLCNHITDIRYIGLTCLKRKETRLYPYRPQELDDNIVHCFYNQYIVGVYDLYGK